MSRRPSWRHVALLLLLAGTARAQVDTGTLTGEVVDAATQAPLAGARVTATGPALGAPRTVVADEAGRYVLGALPPGPYRLEASAQAHLPEMRADLAVKANTTLRAHLALVPESIRLEEVVVTGSRIVRAEVASVAPLVVIGRERIDRSGKLLVADLLQDLPVQANGTNANFNNGGDGSIRASLRGLGSSRTLVLVNGRRYVAGGMGANDSVDLGALPSAAVERIEILLDGASPIYGSDAVGGVINVITRKGWAGTEVTAFGGGTSHGDGTQYEVNLTTGKTSDTGSLMLSLGYGVMEPIWAGHRSWSEYVFNYDPTGATSPLGDPGPYAIGSGFTPNGRAFIVAGPGQPIANPGGDPRNELYNTLVATYPDATSFVPDPTAPLGWRPWAGDALPEYGGDQYNYEPEMYLVTPSQRLSAFATGDVRLGDHARGFVELTYVNRQSQQKMAPEVVFTLPDGLTIAADNLYNPFGVDIWNARGRLVGLGNRTWTQNVESLRVLGGFDGELPRSKGPLAGWRWELSGNFGRTQGTEAGSGMIRKSALAAALGPSFNYGTATAPDWGCGTGPDVRVVGCVPVNLFGARGALTPEQVAAITFDWTARGTNQVVGGLATASGDLFRLWSDRPLGLALGLEYRKVSGTQIPDSLVAAGDTASTDTIQRTSGSQDAREAFVELSIPVLEGAPFAEALEAQLAARALRYSGFGADWTWKVGARWKPVRDLTLRATASTAFRAPSIAELYYGKVSGRGQVEDPCAGVDEAGEPVPVSPWCGEAANNGQATPLVTFENHGNAALRPETARVFTAGVVVEPRFLPGLSVAVDTYGVAIDDTIEFSVLDPIAACYPMQADVAPIYCAQVHRDPVTQALTGVLKTPLNIGTERMAGTDVTVRYGFKSALGRFDLSWESTWLERYDFVRDDGTTIHARGNFDLPRSFSWASPTFRFNAGAAWQRDGLSAGLGVRYLGPMTECFPIDGAFPVFCSFEHGFERRVSAYASWSAQVGSSFSSSAGETRLLVGVQNLLDTRPPTIYTAWYPSDPSYDFMGRFFYVRLTHRL